MWLHSSRENFKLKKVLMIIETWTMFTTSTFSLWIYEKNVLCSNDFTLKLRRKKEEKLNYIPLVYKVYKFLVRFF